MENGRSDPSRARRYLVVYSSSTKTSRASEADERRLVHLLSVKKKKYEMVYVDVSPERREELDAVAPDAPLPALIAGGAAAARIRRSRIPRTRRPRYALRGRSSSRPATAPRSLPRTVQPAPRGGATIPHG